MTDTKSLPGEVEATMGSRRIETCVQIFELSGTEECVGALKYIS
jgi:hypothetical protein